MGKQTTDFRYNTGQRKFHGLLLAKTTTLTIKEVQ